MRWVALLVAAVVLGSVHAQADVCEGVDTTIEFNSDFTPKEISLPVTKACRGDLVYRVSREPTAFVNRVGKRVLLKGTPQVQTEELGVTGVFRVSSPELQSPGHGPDQVKEKKVWPAAGDVEGKKFFLVQEGKSNWVEWTVPEIWKLASINVYETLNPGGVTKVELLTDRDRYVVWDKATNAGGPGFNTKVTAVPGKDGDNETGARKLIFAFSTPTFKPTLVRLFIDASTEWRGIDFVGLQGETQAFPPLPGNLNDEKLTIVPQRDWGCDQFTYQVKMNEWSSPRTVKVCYGGPLGPNGKICSGNGEAANGACKCRTQAPAWKGDNCATPLCPGENGPTVCSGRGKCGGPNDPKNQCVCDPAFIGAGCVFQKVASHCHFVGDPHWATFDHRFTGEGTYYNNYVNGEYLDYYMNDETLNPDHEAIASAHQQPWNWHVVTANQWIIFRKGKDFVKVISGSDIRVGREGETCFEGNMATTILQRQRDGSPYRTPDGLTVTNHGSNGWRVASDVPGKNPSGTVLITYGQWLYLDAYVFIDTAMNGKALGMCGNFDGKGWDLGSYWRHAEPSESVMNKLRVSSEKSFNVCKGANLRPIDATSNLIQTEISLQPKQTESEMYAAAKYISTGASRRYKPLSLEEIKALFASKPNNKSRLAGLSGESASHPGARVTLVDTEAKISMSMMQRLDDAATAGNSIEGLDSALRGCDGKGVNQEDFPKLANPLSREHAALDDCFNRLLFKTPAAEAGDDVVKAAKTTTTGAKAALAILSNFDQWTSTKSDYLNCVADLCASGKPEDWKQVTQEDDHLDQKATDTDNKNIDQTQRIEGKDLTTIVNK